MIYTKLTKKAMKIAFEAHKNQTDKNGMPYIYHPIHLAEQMSDEATVCVALLHDVVEDTDTTFEDLEKEGFTPEIISALKLMTHGLCEQNKNKPHCHGGKACRFAPQQRPYKIGCC